jgi:hypothetical protein
VLEGIVSADAWCPRVGVTCGRGPPAPQAGSGKLRRVIDLRRGRAAALIATAG